MTMQIYADVLNMPVKIAGAEHGPAYGAALFGAVAGGAFADIFEAARRLGKVKDTVYIPDPADAAAYDRLFAEYRLLHDYFGRGGNDVMKRLKAMKQNKEAAYDHGCIHPKIGIRPIIDGRRFGVREGLEEKTRKMAGGGRGADRGAGAVRRRKPGGMRDRGREHRRLRGGGEGRGAVQPGKRDRDAVGDALLVLRQ